MGDIITCGATAIKFGGVLGCVEPAGHKGKCKVCDGRTFDGKDGWKRELTFIGHVLRKLCYNVRMFQRNMIGSFESGYYNGSEVACPDCGVSVAYPSKPAEKTKALFELARLCKCGFLPEYDIWALKKREVAR